MNLAQFFAYLVLGICIPFSVCEKSGSPDWTSGGRKLIGRPFAKDEKIKGRNKGVYDLKAEDTFSGGYAKIVFAGLFGGGYPPVGFGGGFYNPYVHYNPYFSGSPGLIGGGGFFGGYHHHHQFHQFQHHQHFPGLYPYSLGLTGGIGF